MWYLIVSIPDLCTLTYFKLTTLINVYFDAILVEGLKNCFIDSTIGFYQLIFSYKSMFPTLSKLPTNIYCVNSLYAFTF